MSDAIMYFLTLRLQVSLCEFHLNVFIQVFLCTVVELFFSVLVLSTVHSEEHPVSLLAY